MTERYREITRTDTVRIHNPSLRDQPVLGPTQYRAIDRMNGTE